MAENVKPLNDFRRNCVHFWKFMRKIWQLAKDFFNETTIHGLDRILAKGVCTRQRLMWTGIFLLAVSVLFLVGKVLALRHNKKQFQTVIDSNTYEIYRIPFPEIVICNFNRFNWSRISQAENLFLKPQHQKEPFRSTFVLSIAQFSTLSYGKFDRFQKLEHLSSILKQLSYVNITAVVNFMAWRCHEVLSSCLWQNKFYNCCDIFLPRQSQEGTCLSFNNIVTEAGKKKKELDIMWPWRTSGSGVFRGLKVKMHLHTTQSPPQMDSKDGASFLVLEPGVWWYQHWNILKNTKNSVSLKPKLQFYDENTRHLPTSMRNCVFNDEVDNSYFKTLPGQTYMKENCISICQQNHFIKYCNCTLDYFYPPSHLPSCNLQDLLCLAKYNDIFRNNQEKGEDEFIPHEKGLHCKCLMNCYSLSYSVDLRPVPLTEQKLAQYNNSSTVSFEFFFKDDYTIVFRTSMKYTWVDLLVSFGGISALFLGCSFISFLELFYFFLIRLPISLLRMKQQQLFKRRKSQEFLHKLLQAKQMKIKC